MTNEEASNGEGNVRSLERDSGISDHGLDDDNEGEYDDIDCQQFENKTGLSQDLRFLSGMPELCDVMFMVGEEREAMFGVKSILAIRSRVFYKMLYGPRGSKSKSANDAGVSVLGRRLLGRSTGTGNEQRPIKATGSFYSHGQVTGGVNSKTVVQIDEFDPDVFKQLLEYAHTGSVILRPKTLLGLLNAADHFALEELRRACAEYSQKCINLDTVCSLLVTAERYIQYKSSKIFVQRVLDFVDKNGDDVLRLADFVHLPRHVVELILSREELNASEMNKFQAALHWSRHYVLYNPHNSTLSRVMEPFSQYIAFHAMTAQQLMHEIRPLDVVPDRILVNALAYRADPASIDKSQLITRCNAGSGKRDRSIEQPTMDTSHNNRWYLGVAKQCRTKGRIRGRACSVDRNLSKSSNRSSTCSDSGFQDDYYYYYSSNSMEANSNGTSTNRSPRKSTCPPHRNTPGATVVHVESPEDCDSVDVKTKSCHNLTMLSNVTSVHYRF